LSQEEIRVMVDTAPSKALTSSPELEGFCIDSLECYGTTFRQPHHNTHTPDAVRAGTGPTLSTFYTLRRGSNPKARCHRARSADAFVAALRNGFDDFTCGGDTGIFVHRNTALELGFMAELDARPTQVLHGGARQVKIIWLV